MQLREGLNERRGLVDSLSEAGYPVVDLSDNEMAKLHVRHMVGGRSPQVANERLFRFEFPERPGALLDFLNAIGTDWNITLFHYRNHGSDIRTMAAYSPALTARRTRLPNSKRTSPNSATRIGKRSDNPAYAMFLG